MTFLGNYPMFIEITTSRLRKMEFSTVTLELIIHKQIRRSD